MAQTAYCRECGERVLVTETGRCPNAHGRECLAEHENVQAITQASPAATSPDSSKAPLLVAFLVLGMCGLLSVALVFHRLTGDSRRMSAKAFESALSASQDDPDSGAQSADAQDGQARRGIQPIPERVPALTEEPAPETTPEAEPAPTAVSGPSLAERKAIFWELAEAEDRAMAEADAVYDPMNPDYDNIMANIDLNDELYDRYYQEILKRYGITDTIARQIMIEGTKERWPTP